MFSFRSLFWFPLTVLHIMVPTDITSYNDWIFALLEGFTWFPLTVLHIMVPTDITSYNDWIFALLEGFTDDFKKQPKNCLELKFVATKNTTLYINIKCSFTEQSNKLMLCVKSSIRFSSIKFSVRTLWISTKLQSSAWLLK